MLPENQSQPKPRRPHPLERQSEPPVNPPPQRQRAVLHIRTVRPLFTYILIAANLLVYVIGYFDPSLELSMRLGGANNREFVLVNGEYYRLLTSMFLHGGLAHITFNMLSLYIIGRTIEALYGHVRFIAIYMLGGLTGALLSAFLNDVLSVGASGAVFALFAAELIYIYNHRKLLGDFGRYQLRQLIMVLVVNLAIGIISSLNLGTVAIDNWAHIGGFLGGVVLAWFIGPDFVIERYPEKPAEFVAVDANPLRQRYHIVFIYLSVLLGALVVAALLNRASL
jgi:rhomboid protease GluP